MNIEIKCPRCGRADMLGNHTEVYDDGLHKESWCDHCGWTHIEIVDPTTNQTMHTEDNDGFGVASVSGSMGAVSVFFEKPFSKKEAICKMDELKAGYSGNITFESLTFWDGTKIERLI